MSEELIDGILNLIKLLGKMGIELELKEFRKLTGVTQKNMKEVFSEGEKLSKIILNFNKSEGSEWNIYTDYYIF